MKVAKVDIKFELVIRIYKIPSQLYQHRSPDQVVVAVTI